MSVAGALPGAMLAHALVAALGQRIDYEWSSGALRAGRLDRSRGPSLAAMPRDFRPTDPEVGRAILAGRFVLAGAVLDVGAGGDPWDQASPSRRFAAALHGFEWAPDLLACGEAGAREALRLFLDWRRLFYRPNRFVWRSEILGRRLFNLACGAKRMGGVASDLEAATLFKTMLHQARYLYGMNQGPAEAAGGYAVAGLAATALNSKGAAQLASRCLARLSRVLPHTVLPDGGLKSRSPEAGLELLFDLLTLDDVLLQRGRETPTPISRATDRLGAALRFFTLADGRLASFQGGEAADAERVRAAMNPEDEHARLSGQAPHAGYHRLVGRQLQVMVDCAAPAQGAWSLAACAQPLAMEVVCGGDRIFVNGGWSPRAAAPPAFRATAAASTVEVGGRSAGRVLGGFIGRALGPRLVSGAGEVAMSRNDSDQAALLELTHDAWFRQFGVLHTRRLYMDAQNDELRGEDAFSSSGRRRLRRSEGLAIRFHAHPEVQVSLARDGRSVLLRGPADRGWWLRNDAETVALEPSVMFDRGLPRRTVQVVLRSQISQAGEARVRWKLAPVEPSPPLKVKLSPRSRDAQPSTPPVSEASSQPPPDTPPEPPGAA